jgi:hypothetical protein
MHGPRETHIPPKPRSLMLRLPTTGSAFRQLTNRSPSVKRGMRLHVVDDSSALVRRRHLARADVKGSYAAMRLIGLCRYFKSCIAGFAPRPRFSRYALARNLRKPPSKLWHATFRKLPGRTRKSSVLLHPRQTVEILFVCFFISNPCLLFCLA